MNDEEPIVRVGRVFTPPWWFERYLHPELQYTGPREFEVSRVQMHVIPAQEDAPWICGTSLYNFHLEQGLLAGDFGIHEIVALEERGLSFYHRHFAGVTGVGWKSLAYDLANRPLDLYVPFICVRTDKNKVPFLLRDWCKIDNAHTLMKSKALRFE